MSIFAFAVATQLLATSMAGGSNHVTQGLEVAFVDDVVPPNADPTDIPILVAAPFAWPNPYQIWDVKDASCRQFSSCPSGPKYDNNGGNNELYGCIAGQGSTASCSGNCMWCVGNSAAGGALCASSRTNTCTIHKALPKVDCGKFVEVPCALLQSPPPDVFPTFSGCYCSKPTIFINPTGSCPVFQCQ